MFGGGTNDTAVSAEEFEEMRNELENPTYSGAEQTKANIVWTSKQLCQNMLKHVKHLKNIVEQNHENRKD